MKYLVKKPLPDGQQPGEIVDLHEDVGNVFLLVDAVEKIDEAQKPARGRYRRADMQAETRELTPQE